MHIYSRLLVILLILLSGCVKSGPKYSVSVDAMTGGTQYVSEGKKCFLLPATKDVDRNGFEFREYSAIIAKGLVANGYSIVDNPFEANLAIFVEYRISEPNKETVTRSMPVYGQTGYSSSNTFGTYNPYSGSYQGFTNYTPSYGITGYVPVTDTHVYFVRRLVLDATEVVQQVNDVALGKPAWRVVVVSAGSSGDMRRVMPYLVSAAKDYFGVNTKTRVDLTVNSGDPNVIEFTGLEPEKE